MRRVILLLSIVTSLQLFAQNIYIYRNDNNFTQASAKENVIEIVHHIEANDTTVSIGDIESFPLQAVDSIAIRSVDVPSLYFTFPNNPDAEWVTDKDTYIEASLDIDGSGYAQSSSGLSLMVKGRGNSTWSLPKKPMRLKFPSKVSILGFSKAKSYVLLADYTDQTLMRNAVALWVARKMGVASAVDFMPCRVWVNGRFAGTYLLTEKIGINKASVDIDDSTGVLLEMSSEFDEPYKFRSALYDLPVMIKDPDFDEIASNNPDGLSAAERLTTWKEDFNKAESAVRKAAIEHNAGRPLSPEMDDVDAYFDLKSVADYLIVYSLSLNSEIGFPKSCYLYKEAPGKEYLYKFGPAWDFDIAFNIMSYRGQPEPSVVSPESSLWLNKLLNAIICSPKFIETYCSRMDYFLNTVYPELLVWMDNYSQFIEPSAKMDGLRWPQLIDNSGWIRKPRSSFDNRINTAELKQWIQQRVDRMKSLAEQKRVN